MNHYESELHGDCIVEFFKYYLAVDWPFGSKDGNSLGNRIVLYIFLDRIR